MGRGDNDDSAGGDEPVRSDKPDSDPETSVTGLPLDETASMPTPTKDSPRVDDAGPGEPGEREPDAGPDQRGSDAPGKPARDKGGDTATDGPPTSSTTNAPVSDESGADTGAMDPAELDATDADSKDAGGKDADGKDATGKDGKDGKDAPDKDGDGKDAAGKEAAGSAAGGPDTPRPAGPRGGVPRPETPRPESPPEEPVAGARHRRGPGLWLPLILFVALLVAGGIAGSLIVPGAGPDPGAAPPATAPVPGLTQPVPADSTPSEPELPTPPVRPADQLTAWAQRIGGAVNVPPVAMQAYGYAQLTVATGDPSCHLGWTTVAAIAEAESAHGQQGGAVLQSTGRSAPVIVGPVLDGKSGRALVRDTDAGAFDGDTTYDRAMGPLGLTPTVWRGYGIDADGDGILDPYDIDDASLALARLLCSGNEDLTQRAGWNTAVARHHTGTAYAKSVFTSADSYGQRTKDMG